jgi:predicted esterase
MSHVATLPQMLTFQHRYVPAQPDGLPLTLLLLHGSGGDETSLLPIAAEIAPGTALLSPRGATEADGVPRFLPLSQNLTLGQDVLSYRVAELAEFAQNAAAYYRFDVRRMVALGYSNGAAMAASLLLFRPRLLLGALILRPVMPTPPLQVPDLGARPVWIAGGRRDELAPPADAARLAELLQAAGADVSLRWEQAGHKLHRAEMLAARVWLAARFRP